MSAQTAEEAKAELESRGYVEVAEHGDLRPGLRACSRGERYAYTRGTGAIAHVMLKDPSAWSQKYDAADVEVVLVRDKPRFEGSSPISVLASYGTTVAYEQPQEA